MFRSGIPILIAAYMLFPAPGSAQEQLDVIVSSGGPTLVWKKEFSGQIDTVFGGKNGERIAVTTLPDCKRENSLRDVSDMAANVSLLCKGSRLYYLNEKGAVLWEYPSVIGESFVGIYNVTVSSDSNYLAALQAENPCRVENRKINKVSFNEAEESFVYQKDTPFKACMWSVILLDRNGKLLWKKEAKGFPKITPDGNYVMVVPYAGVDVNLMNFEYGNSWYLFNRDGKTLFKKRVDTIDDVAAVLALSEDKYSDGPVSGDSKRMAMANNLYEVSGDTLAKIDVQGLPEQNLYIHAVSPNGGIAVFATSRPLGAEGEFGYDQYLYAVDANTRQVLWGGENMLPDNYGGEIHYARPQDQLRTDGLFPEFVYAHKYPESNKYLVATETYRAWLSILNLKTRMPVSSFKIRQRGGRITLLNSERDILVYFDNQEIACYDLLTGILKWEMRDGSRKNKFRTIIEFVNSGLVGVVGQSTLWIYKYP